MIRIMKAYKMGSIFLFNGIHYILARINVNTYQFISLVDGNRFGYIISPNSDINYPNTVSEESIAELLDRGFKYVGEGIDVKIKTPAWVESLKEGFIICWCGKNSNDFFGMSAAIVSRFDGELYHTTDGRTFGYARPLSQIESNTLVYSNR